MTELLSWLTKHADITLLIRFLITMILLMMLWKALFSAPNEFDEGFKNVLILLVGTTVGYFFNTSKGSTDKQDALIASQIPPAGTVTTVTTTAPKPPPK